MVLVVKLEEKIQHAVHGGGGDDAGRQHPRKRKGIGDAAREDAW